MALKQHIDRVAVYKGKRYPLLWLGHTKYGRRAKLGFWDGSKEFWVNADAVSVEAAEPRQARSQPRRERLSDDDRCELCDRNKWTCGHCIGW